MDYETQNQSKSCFVSPGILGTTHFVELGGHCFTESVMRGGAWPNRLLERFACWHKLPLAHSLNFLELLQPSKYFVTHFTVLTIGSGEIPTMETIDSYMNRLHSIIMANPQENENLIATVRDVVNRLER